MRISDWSSDVCSSDLGQFDREAEKRASERKDDMIESDFESLKRRLAQGADYKAGARMGYAVHAPVDIKSIRAKTKLTQAAFAKKLHISTATLRDWEQGRRMPEGPARTLLGMVDADPEAAFKLLAKVGG